MEISYVGPDYNFQQDALYGLETDQPPLMDSAASLYGGYSLSEPVRRFLFAGYVPQLIVFPRTRDLPLAAFDQKEDQLAVPSLSYIVGYGAGSQQAAGFRFTVYDIGAKQYAVSDQWDNESTGAQDDLDPDSQPVPLVSPYLIMPPGLLQIKVANLSNAQNDCQLLIYVAVPYNVEQSQNFIGGGK